MENIQSHVVLISGKKDLRVNHFNSEFYFKRLLSMGKSAEYFSFPCSNHALATSKASIFLLNKTFSVFKKFKK